MYSYLIGFFKNLFSKNISFFTLITRNSKISNKAVIHRQSKIYESFIDDYSYVVSSSIIYAKIGKFCSIGEGCIIGMANHTLDKLSTSPIFTEKNNALRKRWISNDIHMPYKVVEIGNDVWIGARVIIKGGIKVGDGSVIGAGAVVTKDIPPFAIVGGVPAKIIKYRFDESLIQAILSNPWWHWDEKKIKKSLLFFQKKLLSSNNPLEEYNLL